MTIPLYSVMHADLPIFYLDPQVQGIVSEEHAQRVATSVTGRPAAEHFVMLLQVDAISR